MNALCTFHMIQSATSLALIFIAGSLLFVVTKVTGQKRPINCRRYRDRDGQYQITRDDNSVYCMQQNLYLSALSSSSDKPGPAYVRALLDLALSRCGDYRPGNKSPKSIQDKCKKKKCHKENVYRNRQKRRKIILPSERKTARKHKCSWERKEVRMMSNSEWKRFTNRLNILKRPIRLSNGGSFIPYDILSDLHRDNPNLRAAHGGPNFLGWHRIYLLIMEAALGVPIPYWDSRLDYNMKQPTDSMLWTDEFFGPGFGVVDSGPFAEWITADNISIVRNIGSSGSLISESMVNNILRHKKHEPIVEPLKGDDVSLERIHGGPHNWVDGQLSSIETAPQDPVFFLHHSFVDYFWQLFRNKMRKTGKINPAKDYPNKGPKLQKRKANMIPFGDIRNIEGYGDFIESLTRYQESPKCPVCGRSKHLECDKTTYLCKSKARPGVYTDVGGRGSSSRARPKWPLYLGTKFLTAHTDTRTRGDVLRFLPLRRRPLLV
ncbi:putative tyrosinase-like protein tyr-3 [Ylistrum balloti]|uniref:putative tyrosinase-like protein tyr-3 n=1 Tax=Ylistrum balloti TaxID=509963 RepID=UPI00290586D2|nr:putative tyrosinase-like protein tyr-3 [Ylistrum balloti]